MTTIFQKLLYWALSIKIAFADGGATVDNVGQTLPNPLGEGTTISSLLSRIMGYLLNLAIPIATVMILYGAFQILTAAGDPKKAEDGKKTIIYTLVGFAIILLASGIPYIIKEILGAS
jgi:hypothetical protein